MLRWVPGLVLAMASGVALISAQDSGASRNAIIFVADGLARSAVNPIDTPALDRIRTEGVDFANSHSVFPSQTMPNAAAIATGHLPGDTGQFADRLFLGYPLFDSVSPGRERGTMVPGLESASVLADVNDHFGGNVLREASLLAFARSYGYNTATIGKTGASAFQDVSEVSPVRGILRDPVTIILDSATGTPNAVPLNAPIASMIRSAGLTASPPPSRNVEHEQWFADVATRAILPAFARSAEPFVMVFWSQGHADRSLGQILAWLDAHPDVRDKTNIVVTADRRPSTVSSPSLAIDLAQALDQPLYDPAAHSTLRTSAGERTSGSTALIGGTGKIEKPTDAKVVVAGTSIYVPDNDRSMVQQIVRFLTTQDDVGGIFVYDRFGEMPGALQMSDIGLVGGATTPKPAVVINFKIAASPADAFSNMAAIGPDFKKRFVDQAPVGNADVQPTLARILSMKIPSLGKLRGRVLSEALTGGPQAVRFARHVARSRPSARGESTVLMYQRVGDQRYVDEVCFTRTRTCQVR